VTITNKVSLKSVMAGVTPIADVPDAPTIGAATNVGTSRAFNNGSATVAYTAAATGGTPTTFTATSTPGSFTATGASPITVTGLQSATSYTFAVSAANANGTLTSAASSSITATTVPQAPTIGTATLASAQAYSGSASISVPFTAGATGGAAVSTYTVTSSSGATGSGASSPVSVSETVGNPTSTARTYTVTATNTNGTGSASSASNSIAAVSVPQAPTIGSATAGDASATVAYTANATGGAAVSTFTATSSPGGFTGTGASPISVTGLTNGTAYTFTVTATNSAGTSAASSASTSVTPAVPPVGTNWTLTTLPDTANAMTTSINSNFWVFQSRTNALTMYYSSTGLSWTQANSVTGMGGLYSAVRGSAAKSTTAVFATLNSATKGAFTSNSGSTWGEISTSAWGTSPWAGAIATDGTYFVMAKQFSATNTAYSGNANSWTNNGTLASGDYYTLTYSAGTGTYKWAVSRSDFDWYFATDYNSAWTLRTHSNAGRVVGENWGAGTVFMSYNSGTTTGMTCTGASAASTAITYPQTVNGTRCLAYASTPARWICSNSTGGIATSDNNGATWTIRTTPSGFTQADNIVYNSTSNRAIISYSGSANIAYSG
jgi:hypothetical protein